MSEIYKLYGVELSPYSVKVRSYLRYKNIPHEWIVRSAAVMPEFQKFAKLPIIPLLVTPELQGLQDSTPIIEEMEQRFPDPSIYLPDLSLNFIYVLIEEYADEWCNKPMFHYRWWYAADQNSAARGIALSQLGENADPSLLAGATDMIKQRMIPRLAFVGSNENTKQLIETSFHELVSILNAHLQLRNYLFGGKPSFADFALYAQLYENYIDPTPGAFIREKAPNLVAWIERMLNPVALGEFESWSTLAPTLMPLLKQEIGERFLPWSEANARALAAGEKHFSVELNNQVFSQEAQKYHAKSLAALKVKFQLVRNEEKLRAILSQVNCLSYLEN